MARFSTTKGMGFPRVSPELSLARVHTRDKSQKNARTHTLGARRRLGMSRNDSECLGMWETTFKSKAVACTSLVVCT